MAKRKTATEKEIYEFWSNLLRDETTDLKDKMKVSELLAKCLGMFNASGEADEGKGVNRLSLAEKLELINRIKNDDTEGLH